MLACISNTPPYAVEELFQALCDASALNPDSDMEEEAGAQLFFDEAEVGKREGGRYVDAHRGV